MARTAECQEEPNAERCISLFDVVDRFVHIWQVARSRAAIRRVCDGVADAEDRPVSREPTGRPSDDRDLTRRTARTRRVVRRYRHAGGGASSGRGDGAVLPAVVF